MAQTRASLLTLGLTLGGLSLALAAPVAAQTPPPPSPEQARALEAQIGTWLKTNFAGTGPLPTRPVELTAEGDHYTVRIPFGPGKAGSIEPPDAAFTALARPIGGTRWSVDNQQLPPSMTIKTTESVPNDPDTKNPSPDATHKEPVTYRIKLGAQTGSGVIDTSFTTPANSSSTIQTIDVEKEAGAGVSLSHFGLTTTQASTRPTDASHTDVLSDVAITGYATKSELPDGTAVTLQADRLHVVTSLSGLAQAEFVPLIRLLAELGQLADSKKSDAEGPTPAQKVKLHALLQQAQGLLTGGTITESAEGVKYDIGGKTGRFDKVALSFGGDAPGDMLAAKMEFTLDGLVVDAVPPAFASYVPSHIAIRPVITNVSVGALTKMGLDATAPASPSGPDGKAPAKPNQADMAALFAKGGITYGFDGLLLDIAGTTLTGTGRFTSATPTTVTGQAELTATGLDALLAKAQGNPMLAQAVPVVIFLKGIAKTSGDRSVWQIAVNNAKVTVNGVDLSALMGGMGK